jgi:hypothetical protein
LRAVCKVTSVKAPGPGGFTEVTLHAALSLAQHHSAWWPENTWLTSSSHFRNPGNYSLSDAEFCSLRVPVFMRLWRAKRRQTANTQSAPNPYAGHKRQQLLQSKNSAPSKRLNLPDDALFLLINYRRTIKTSHGALATA